MRSFAAVVVLVVGVLATSCASPARDAAPAAPKTVRALRYRPKIVEGVMDWIHGGGVECDELWFPERNVVANVSFETRTSGAVGEVLRFQTVPVLHAFFGEARTRGYDVASKETRDLPTEEVEVAAELAERIFALAEMNARLQRTACELGIAAADAGLVRETTTPPLVAGR